MTLNSFIKGALSAAAITMAGSFAYAQQAGGGWSGDFLLSIDNNLRMQIASAMFSNV